MVEGKIIDADSGNPIENAHVIAQNNSRSATATDKNGNFSLPVAGQDLVVSHVSYGQILIPAGQLDSSFSIIELTMGSTMLDPIDLVSKTSFRPNLLAYSLLAIGAFIGLKYLAKSLGE